jgi:hypothetical protein
LLKYLEDSSMAAAYFCLFENTDHTSTRAEIRAVQPEAVIEAPGWLPRYVAPLPSDTTVRGAEIVLARMNAEFADHRAARGLFDIPYPEVRQWLSDQYTQANASTQHRPARRLRRDATWYFGVAIRVIAGIVALLLFVVYVVANVWGTILCLIITPFQRRSLLYKAAERSLMFRMLDWQKPIHCLALVALNRSR